jgi:SAM-dependent methyltransferase
VWDERYAGEGFFYGTEPNDFLRAHAALIPAGGRVLCLAEGEGRNAVFLAGLGLSVAALDQSAVGLRKAHRLADARGVRITTLQENLENYCIEPGCWDAIVSIWCHLPASLRGKIHSQIATGLKPGGVFLLEAYRPEQLKFGTGGPQTEDLLPTLAQLRGELSGLEFERAAELERDVQEGQGHAGQSAVVQVLARKSH